MNIEYLDARISALECELLQLRMARNALTPLGRLPHELVLRIAENLTPSKETSHVCLHRMSILCRQLYHALTNSPKLWATIHYSMPSSWTKCCLARAVSHPLHLDVWISPRNTDLFDAVIKLTPTIASLSVCFDDLDYSPSATHFITALSTASMPMLKALDLASTKMSHLPVFHWKFSGLPLCENLASLRAMDIRLSNIPYLPALRYVFLRRTRCSLQELYTLFIHSQKLERVELSRAVDVTLLNEAAPTWSQVPLSGLQCFDVDDTLEVTAALVGMLPCPSTEFDVHIVHEAVTVPMWTSTTGPNRIIMSKMAKFWSAITGDAGSFPSGLAKVFMDDTLGTSQLMFSVDPESWEHEISFHYTSAGKILMNDPILAHVKELALGCYGYDLNPAPTQLNLDLLPNVETVVVWGASCVVDAQTLIAEVGMLETWISSRHEQGRPLKSIKFERCSINVKLIFDRLVAGRVAESITWK